MNNFEAKYSYANISFPDSLTHTDRELIISQCELQSEGNPTEEEISAMAQVYTQVKEKSENQGWIESLTPEQLLQEVDNWAVILDPINARNRKTEESFAYRHQDAKFRVDVAEIKKAVSPSEIPEKMQRWAGLFVSTLQENYQSDTLPENEIREISAGLYDMFESTHPYSDGNGRLGDLMWKLMMRSGLKEWPEELPPDLFPKPDGANNDSIPE